MNQKGDHIFLYRKDAKIINLAIVFMEGEINHLPKEKYCL